jgi:uncharacterized protein involved in outer membrane biogenesis
MIKRNYSGWIIAILAAVIITAACTFIFTLYAGKDMIAKSFLEKYVYDNTGIKLSIGRLDIGIFRPYIHAENIMISNPPGFPEGIMFDIPLFYVEYDVQAIIKKQAHIKFLDLDIKLYNMVRNRAGLVNIDSLNVSSLKKGITAAGGGGPGFPIMFDSIHLKGGRVVYTDNRQTPPKIVETEVNINDTYNNVTDIYALGESIARKAFSGGPLAGVDFRSLQTGVVSAVSNGTQVIQSATKQTMEAVKGVLQAPVRSQDK